MCDDQLGGSKTHYDLWCKTLMEPTDPRAIECDRKRKIWWEEYKKKQEECRHERMRDVIDPRGNVMYQFCADCQWDKYSI